MNKAKQLFYKIPFPVRFLLRMILLSPAFLVVFLWITIIRTLAFYGATLISLAHILHFDPKKAKEVFINTYWNF